MKTKLKRILKVIAHIPLAFLGLAAGVVVASVLAAVLTPLIGIYLFCGFIRVGTLD